MASFEDLKGRITDTQRALLTSIWDYYLERGQWILRRHLHLLFEPLGRSGVQAALRSLGGTVVFEGTENGLEIYRLTMLGVLLSDHGEKAQYLLGRYLSYVRDQFRQNPDITQIKSKDVESALGMVAGDTRLLWEFLLLSGAWSGSAGGNKDGWGAGLPRDVEDLLAVRDFEACVLQNAMEGYDSRVPIDRAGRDRSIFSQPRVVTPSRESEDVYELLQEETPYTSKSSEPGSGNRPRFELSELWGPLRAALSKHLSFSAIKDVVALAGLDVTSLAHLTQHGARPAANGALMDGIDGLYRQLPPERKELFIRTVAEEGVRRSPVMDEDLDTSLRRLGWQFLETRLLPVEILDRIDVDAVPEGARHDLAKAASRFRDGDLTGALSAACSAVDSACANVYNTKQLGDVAKAASFQEKVARSLDAQGALDALEDSLRKLGWVPEEALRLRRNVQQSLNQAAYVMQSLRSRMSDAHGSKPALDAVVFDSVRWATIIMSFLK